MIWRLSHRYDSDAVPIANRHYNRQSPKSPQFVPPGRCLVLKAAAAVWVTSWPMYVQHAWPNAWINTTFRNESDELSSILIRDAIAATRYEWPDVPPPGIVTFIDPNRVRPRIVRGRQTFGYCYFAAGFDHVGYTKGGLWVMRMPPERMPEPEPAIDRNLELFDRVS